MFNVQGKSRQIIFPARNMPARVTSAFLPRTCYVKGAKQIIHINAVHSFHDTISCIIKPEASVKGSFSIIDAQFGTMMVHYLAKPKEKMNTCLHLEIF